MGRICLLWGVIVLAGCVKPPPVVIYKTEAVTVPEYLIEFPLLPEKPASGSTNLEWATYHWDFKVYACGWALSLDDVIDYVTLGKQSFLLPEICMTSKRSK